MSNINDLREFCSKSHDSVRQGWKDHKAECWDFASDLICELLECIGLGSDIIMSFPESRNFYEWRTKVETGSIDFEGFSFRFSIKITMAIREQLGHNTWLLIIGLEPSVQKTKEGFSVRTKNIEKTIQTGKADDLKRLCGEIYAWIEQGILDNREREVQNENLDSDIYVEV